jgi:hypothetical protein
LLNIVDPNGPEVKAGAWNFMAGASKLPQKRPPRQPASVSNRLSKFSPFYPVCNACVTPCNAHVTRENLDNPQ